MYAKKFKISASAPLRYLSILGSGATGAKGRLSLLSANSDFSLINGATYTTRGLRLGGIDIPKPMAGTGGSIANIQGVDDTSSSLGTNCTMSQTAFCSASHADDMGFC